MKYLKSLANLFILLFLLSSCRGSTVGQLGCTYHGELCIDMVIEEPMRFGELNSVTINVTSTIDIAGLRIYLEASPPAILFEDLQNWTDMVISWEADLKANQPQSFTRNFLFEKDGYYGLVVMAMNTQYRAENSLALHQENGTVEFFYANTPVPHTQHPLPTVGPELLETLHALPTRTPFPTPRPIPTFPSTPTAPVYPPPSTPPGEAPGEEPYP